MGISQGVTMRHYRGGDEPDLLAMWREAMPRDTIDMRLFARRVLCDPNFVPAGLQIAEAGGEIVGFARDRAAAPALGGRSRAGERLDHHLCRTPRPPPEGHRHGPAGQRRRLT